MRGGISLNNSSKHGALWKINFDGLTLQLIFEEWKV